MTTAAAKDAILGVVPTPPVFEVPRNACDCHTHIFGPVETFPFSRKRLYTPGDASIDDLNALHRALHIDHVVIVQFESAEAIEQADEIATVEGVDMVLIGVNDMLASMGLPGQYEHARVRDAYARTIAACRKHGKHVGVGGLASRPELAAEFVRMGARYVSTGTDLGFLLAAATAKAKEVREMSPG